MAQSKLLIDVLKLALKQHNVTYAEVADKLNLSEASIKRLFSSQNFSLKRLDEICQVISLDMTDLLHLLEASKQRISYLSEQQEDELVKDPDLLLAAICTRNQMSFQQITSNYQFEELELVQLLARLDRMKFIELLPKNHIKLMVAKNFHWIPRGPVENLYATQVEKEFFRSRFYKENETRIFTSGLLTMESQHQLQKKLNRVIHEFDELQQQDADQPIDKRMNVGMVLAMRPWTLAAFDTRRKAALQH